MLARDMREVLGLEALLEETEEEDESSDDESETKDDDATVGRSPLARPLHESVRTYGKTNSKVLLWPRHDKFSATVREGHWGSSKPKFNFSSEKSDETTNVLLYRIDDARITFFYSPDMSCDLRTIPKSWFL